MLARKLDALAAFFAAWAGTPEGVILPPHVARRFADELAEHASVARLLESSVPVPAAARLTPATGGGTVVAVNFTGRSVQRSLHRMAADPQPGGAA